MAKKTATSMNKKSSSNMGRAMSMQKQRTTVVRKKEVSKVMKAPKLTKLGQHLIHGEGCISTELNGAACCRPRAEHHIPYCKQCMKFGDPSLKVQKHPKFGKCLVAARSLPRGYITAWWGTRRGKKSMPEKNWEWALETSSGVIDAVPHQHGSQLQFTQCPGPSEKTTVDFVPRNKETALLRQKEKMCLLFANLCDIPKNHQFTMMYNKDEKTTEQFFKDRGIVRSDIGCPQYPALRKAGKATSSTKY